MVSVVVPVYNRENTIGRAIKSILAQTCEDMEIIVVDDGSSDNSVEVIRSFSDSRIKLIELESNGGAARARNAGLKTVHGEYIAFLDSDDRWEEHFVQKQKDYLDQQGAMASFCAFSQCINGRSLIVPNDECRHSISNRGVKETLKKGNFIGTPTLMFRKELLDEVGMFDESIGCLEDFEYVLRVSQRYNIAFLDEVLVFVYPSDNSISDDDALHARAYEYLSDKYAGYLDWRLLLEYIKHKCMHSKCFDVEKERFELTVQNYLESMDSCENRVENTRFIVGEMYGLSCEKEWNYTSFTKKLKNKRFYIYGAGIVAIKVYKKTLEAGVAPYKFVITSQNNDENKMIDGIEVVNVDSIQKKYPVIVAVSYKYQTEIVQELIDRGIEDYYVYSC